MNYICGEYFAENSKYVFDEGYLKFFGGVYIPKGQENLEIKHNHFIFYENKINNNYIFANPHYLKEVVEFIEKNDLDVILITHKLDSTIDENFINRQGITFSKIANHKKIIHWYAQNGFINHPKLTYIPIGIECPRIELDKIIEEEIKEKKEKDLNVLVNFNPNPIFSFFNERQILSNILKDKKINNSFNFLNRKTFINQLTRSLFCLSPTGGGIDCHRTWTALYCGSIPVLTRNNISEKISTKFPVFLIDKWEDLDTGQFNKENFNKIKKNKIEINNLNLDNFINILNIFNENSNSINSI